MILICQAKGTKPVKKGRQRNPPLPPLILPHPHLPPKILHLQGNKLVDHLPLIEILLLRIVLGGINETFKRILKQRPLVICRLVPHPLRQHLGSHCNLLWKTLHVVKLLAHWAVVVVRHTIGFKTSPPFPWSAQDIRVMLKPWCRWMRILLDFFRPALIRWLPRQPAIPSLTFTSAIESKE